MSTQQDVYIKPKNSAAIFCGKGSASIILSETHTISNDVVSQPLEDGTSLFDHIIVLPDELEVVIHTGNAPRPGSSDRYPSQLLYSQLKEIRNKRDLCSVYTLHETYSNLAIKDITVPNVAPYPGRTDIVVKFIRVDPVKEAQNQFLRSLFQEAVTTLSSSVDFLGEEFLDYIELTEGQLVRQLAEETLNAAKGILPSIQDIADSASSITDLGEGELFDSLPNPFENSSITDSMQESEKMQILNSLLAIYDNPSTSVLKTPYAAMKNMVQTISNAYSTAGNFTQDVRNRLQTVCTGISFISNLSIGAQRFIRTIGGQVLGITSYFDALTNNWRVNLTDAQGVEMISGAALVLGVNVLAGLHPIYTSALSDGTVSEAPVTFHGMYMSEPVPGQIPVETVTNKGIESSPYAFKAGSNSVAPCSIFVFLNDEAAQAYNDLIYGLIERQLNFNIDEMDYTFLT